MDPQDLKRKPSNPLAASPPKQPMKLKTRLASSALVAENKKLRTVLKLRGRKGRAVRQKFGSNRQTCVPFWRHATAVSGMILLSF